MEINKEVLSKVSSTASQKVSQDFSKLAQTKVEVLTAEAELVSNKEVARSIKPEGDKSLIAYAQMIEGLNGVSLLLMTREEALNFIDLLNGKELGTTGVLMELDRSAIKETLNILANSYLTSLAKELQTDLMIGAPYMLPLGNLERKLEDVSANGDGESIVFKTALNITEHQIEAQLYLLFNKELVEALKQ